ncbi:26S proteasome non-ATPase regulatory subunit 9 [Paramicrosporidium saccamoebae]|uniref:26S proteasome non-ATPase regulatory subunit 9 n=1 Tax=Paramicrosporidium saccamoebae TaxID=1246581 RepID=A0A2H9TIB1_9FUNG|nr:26S proteasome non-ATPase regulatory subunit 9 [Paramicrosporidium saccamoebae]
MGPGMDRTLVDSEGFPLPNIDLYTVKELRGATRSMSTLRWPQFVGMMTDYRQLMAHIEAALPAALNSGGFEAKRQPFLRIETVTPNSPAHNAVTLHPYSHLGTNSGRPCIVNRGHHKGHFYNNGQGC